MTPPLGDNHLRHSVFAPMNQTEPLPPRTFPPSWKDRQVNKSLQYSVISALTGIHASKKDDTKVAVGDTCSSAAPSRHRDQRIILLWLELRPLWAFPEKISK